MMEVKLNLRIKTSKGETIEIWTYFIKCHEKFYLIINEKCYQAQESA